MIKYDKIKYLTVLIKNTDENGVESLGTGFFIKFNIDGKPVPVIVTVKHVIENAKETYMFFHYKPNGGKHIAVLQFPCKEKWIFSKQSELCCCPLHTLNEEFLELTGSNIYACFLNEKNILKKEELNNIDAVSEVIMAGYPAGVYSSPFVYPVLRKGNLAAAPSDNIVNQKGYADIASVGGSSGSPLLLYGENAKLIGIINQTVMENPFSSADLGIYIYSYNLFDLKDKL